MKPITFPERWAPEHPDRIQLYSIATPNGKKVGIALEELGLPYEPHRIDIGAGDQFDPEFVAINPNSKIPAIIDPYGDEGRPLAIMESGAILLHLADKAGRLAGSTPRARSEVTQWLFFQVGSIGPMFGQFGHFYRFAKGKTDTYGEKRYGDETKRLLGVLDRQLDGREWLVDDYSIADIATAPWVDGLAFYGGLEELEFASFENVVAWLERFKARPGVQRGYEVTPF